MQTYEQLLEENRELRAQLAERDARIAKLEALLASALSRIAELEAQLKTNSRNSSKPPSSDPPNVAAHERQKRKKGGGTRSRGGQRGHKGTTRSLLPPEKVKHFVELKPEVCEKCAAALTGEDPRPIRSQQTEIPPIEPEVTEYRRHTLTCCACGAKTTADLPEGVTNSAFGSRLTSIAAACSGMFRMSRRMAGYFLDIILNVDMSLGSVSACESTVSESVEAPVDEAREHIKNAPDVNADETGYRQAVQIEDEDGRADAKASKQASKAWLWTAVTPLVTVFLIHAKRGRDAAVELLGTFRGILTSDRWNAYNFVDAARRQLCWAHLLRDFEWIAEFGAESARIGKDLLADTRRMFTWWHELKAGGLSRSGFQERMGPLIMRVEELLAEGAAGSHKKSAGKCREIRKLRAALWTFVTHENIEPTNNAAERALRPAVIWRRLSFGSASKRGSRFVERMLTVTATCRQQGRNVLEYLVAACEAHARGEPAPSLLPRAAEVRLVSRGG
jgi:transposase